MKIFNNEITIHRNETFTIDKYLENRDGSPYIISKMLTNPYFLLTVSSSRYEQTNRYVLNKWLNLSASLRFNTTIAVQINSSSWDLATLPAGYEGDRLLMYANEAVFYIEDNNGDRTYRYWHYTSPDDGSGETRENYDGEWIEYRCRIITSFAKSITSTWIEQNYLYGILLVSGTYNSEEIPIVVYDTVYTILEPTKLIVLSNLKGGMR